MRRLTPRLVKCVALSIFIALSSTSSADELGDLSAKAGKGDAQAQFELAQRYERGTGVAKDEAAALAWYGKAAAQGHTKAEVSLGSIYAHGFGVPQDWAKSIEWYRRAAAKGDTTAEHNLGLEYAHGHGVPRDEQQAARWFRLAADQGHARAQYNLGELYEDGRGVAQSDVEACILYRLAAAHDNQEHIFGKSKAEEVLMKLARIEKKLNPEQLASVAKTVIERQSLAASHPRKFGFPGGLPESRGWYVWHGWNPETWEAEVSRDPPQEKWRVRVLPWVTTYRYGVYGARPDELLPGEKANISFAPHGTQKRGLVIHWQDEVSQMIGHGHFWRVLSRDDAAKTFTAQIMAGEKPLGSPPVTFAIDPACQYWQVGKKVAVTLPEVGAKLYMTWVYRGDRPTVMLLADEPSLAAIKQEEADRIAKQIAAEGLSGQIEVIEGSTVYVMVYSTYWLQAQALKPGVQVRLTSTGPGFRPTGETVEARVVAAKNRGTYGSGTTDLVLEFASAEQAAKIAAWLDGRVIRVLLPPMP